MALKVMPKASTKLQGFLREYCISLHLSCHPCIVGLFGIAFQSNEHYCFAQELVIGRDLFAVIQPKVSQTLAKHNQESKPLRSYGLLNTKEQTVNL